MLLRVISGAVLLLIAMTVLGCKTEVVTKIVTPTPVGGAPGSQASTPNPPAATATAKAPPSPTPGAVIGNTLETNDGSRFTVYQMIRNVPGERFLSPDPGREWIAFDVEGCAGPNTNDLSVNPFFFSLRLADNTSAKTAFGGQEPTLHSENNLFPDDCLRGWVTFDVPAGAVLDSLRLDDYAHKAKWDIP